MLQINKHHLKQFYEKCQKDKLIGIDTEFYRVNSYYPKLCLIQLSNTKESVFLDPIKHDLNLEYLRKILFNTKIKKIFHAARQDIEIFFNIFKKIPRPIVDTQINLISLGYPHSTSYAKACLDLLRVNLDKNNQFIDWRKRPLSKEQITYALNDVRHLIPLYKKINQKLDPKNNKTLKSHYQKIINIKIYTQRADRSWEKLKFIPSNNKELEKLKQYCRIRENIAMRQNIPAKRIISDSEIKLIFSKKANVKLKRNILEKLELTD